MEYKCKCGTDLIVDAGPAPIADEDNAGRITPMIWLVCPKCSAHFNAAYNPDMCSIEEATKMAYDMFIKEVCQTLS